ncbi:MAG: porin family protein [Bacteroidales bacterium]|jgi:hypothetical protein|nr:porin family protein [Bacteroidales bacterium]
MKIKLFLNIIVLIFIFQSSYAQDLIIKQSGDSINCKIQKLDKGYIFYSQKTENKLTDHSIHSNDVKKYVFGYYGDNEYQEYKIKQEAPLYQVKEKDYTWISIGINAGIGYRLNEIKNTTPYELGDYYKKLRKGINFSGDITYYFNKYCGMGLNASYFSSSNEATIRNELGIGNGSISDNIILWNIGILVSGRYESKWSIVYLNAGLGSANYINNYSYINSDIKITGSTLYFGGDLGVDFKLGSNFAVGLKASYNSGKLKSIKRKGEIQNLDKDAYLNLQNLRITAGIRILIR